MVGVAPPLTPAALTWIDRGDPIGAEAAPGRGPFDRGRNGALIGQAAAAVLFERKDAAERRGVVPLAGIAACDTACGATLPESILTATGLALSATERPVDLWFAHATGSVLLDRIQCETVGPLIARCVTTSSKGTVGLAHECAGLIDLALAVESMRRQAVPPVGFLREPDPVFAALDLVVGSPRRVAASAALITTMGHSAGAVGVAGAAIVTQHNAAL